MEEAAAEFDADVPFEGDVVAEIEGGREDAAAVSDGGGTVDGAGNPLNPGRLHTAISRLLKKHILLEGQTSGQGLLWEGVFDMEGEGVVVELGDGVEDCEMDEVTDVELVTETLGVADIEMDAVGVDVMEFVGVGVDEAEID